MQRTISFIASALVVAASLSCSKSSAPAAPTVTASTSTTTTVPPATTSSTTTTTTIPATPNVSAPIAQSPVRDQLVTSLTPSLTATAATVDVAGASPQYRFQLFNDVVTLVQDSGLVTTPAWTTPTLTPNKRYTWKVRAEYQGLASAWTDVASFTTPDPPPAYRGTIGDWQSCAPLVNNKDALVRCVHAAVRPIDSVGGMELVKRVAWLLRGEGGGLLIKTSGDNTILWQGYSFSSSRVCYPDGHIYKVLSDAGPGGANGPQWVDNDFVDKSLYVPAIDPSKP